MKKLSTLFVMLFLATGIATASSDATNSNYRGAINSFIFVEGGVEFAVFPDGQFDFNFLNNGSRFAAGIQTGNVNISFNTGFNYDPFVQYDAYGAVIQIENTPVYYNAYGRIIQAGTVAINYRNGFVHNIGNLFVTYRRPGIVFNYRGYVNNFNRHYFYQPWHAFYAPPIFNRCIVYNSPYRNFYNPIRFAWTYHRNHWNLPTYYNGRLAYHRGYRDFYRPNDRVNFRDFERGRRDSRGRLTTPNRVRNVRENIARGRQSMERSATSRSTRLANAGTSARRHANHGSIETRASSRERSSTRSATSINSRAVDSRATRVARNAVPNVDTRVGISNSRSSERASRPTRSSRSTAAKRASRTINRSAPTVRSNRSTSSRSQAASRTAPTRVKSAPRSTRSSSREAATRSNSRSTNSRGSSRSSTRG